MDFSAHNPRATSENLPENGPVSDKNHPSSNSETLKEVFKNSSQVPVITGIMLNATETVANPKPLHVHDLVKRALKEGRLQKTPCVYCGSRNVVGHHWDYAKPLDVMWVCQAHHLWLHEAMAKLGQKPLNTHLAAHRQYHEWRKANPGQYKPAKTHCKRGHEFTPENTGVSSSGGRRCLTCHKVEGARYRALRKARRVR